MLKWSLSSLALVATIIGGIVAAWPFIEPFMAATRGYAREVSETYGAKMQLAQAQLQVQQHDILVDVAKGKLEATENDLFKAQLEMKKTSDPATQEFINNQINKLQNTKNAIENQLKALNARP